MKLSDLKPAKYNPRTITADALSGLGYSIEEFGDLSGIVFNECTGSLVAGHQRLKALQDKYGDLEIICINNEHVTDCHVIITPEYIFPVRYVDWHIEKEKAANVAANNQHIQGDFTPDLGDILGEIKADLSDDLYESLQLPLLEIDVPEVELGDYQGETEPDEAPEPVTNPIIQAGDLVTLGKHRLLCGDSLKVDDMERLMQGEKADMVFTDPPYNVHNVGWDKAFEIENFISSVIDHLKENSFFAFTIQMPSMCKWLSLLENTCLSYKDHIVWVKRIATAVAQEITRSHESLFIYSKGKPQYCQTKGRYEDVKLPGVLVDVVTLESIDRHMSDLRLKSEGKTPSKHRSGKGNPLYDYMKSAKHDRSPELVNFTNVWSFLPDTIANTEQSEHPTQKPLKLIARGVELMTSDKALALDPCLGSGTTLIACEQLNRTCYGMEITPKYVQVATERWINYTSRPEDVTVERDGKQYKWGELNG